MTSNDWLSQRARLGLEPDNGDAVLAAPLPENGFCDLSGEALLGVDGAEAVPFLQGQLTSDVRLLGDGAVLPAAHLTPKGRAIATFLTWQVDNTIYLQFPRGLEDAVTRRLRMFLLRSKASVGPADGDLVRIGAWGENAAQCLAEWAGTRPEAPLRRVVGQDGITLLSLPGAVPRLEAVLPAAAALQLATRLHEAGAVPCVAAAWRLLDIRAGLGWVRPETGEAFIPQMLNYDFIGGISFSKGCYVGQEVVARLHHLGEVKRRAYPGHCGGTPHPRPGRCSTVPMAAAARAPVRWSTRSRSATAAASCWPSSNARPSRRAACAWARPRGRR